MTPPNKQNEAYYNEIEPSAVLWLQAAMDAGIIMQGDIDTRPIQEVKPDDLRGYTQHHFFAGIGGWSIALRLAGWPDDRPVWTGSCPCQPFSTAGRQKGQSDERHLWSVWFKLIRESSPATVFGEQVANAIAKGWLDSVYDDMEGEGYAVASAVLPACGVGAPHKRDRLWFVADKSGKRLEERASEPLSGAQQLERSSALGNASESGLERHGQPRYVNATQGWEDASRHFAEDDLAWINCPDEKARPVKSGLCLLVDGIPARLRKAALHGFGNAIVPQVAAEFIKSSLEVTA